VLAEPTHNGNGGPKVSASLPLRVHKLGPESRKRRSSAMLGGPAVAPSQMTQPNAVDRRDPLTHLAQRVEIMEQKLDTLLTLVLRKQQQEARRLAVPLEIDALGLSYSSTEPLTVGQALELEITLGIFPPLEINCICEVTACEPEPGDRPEDSRFRVCAAFDAISEADLDKIHRFILTTQRERRRAHPRGDL